MPQLKYSQLEPQAAFPYCWLSYNMPDNYYLTVVKIHNSERQQGTGAENTWNLRNTQEEPMGVNDKYRDLAGPN